MGIITLATIHQPSKHIWDTFDDTLLLTKGGRLAFMGDMGSKSQNVMGYFSALSGEQPPALCNPADFVLAALGDAGPTEAEKAFKESGEFATLTEAIQSSRKTKVDDAQIRQVSTDRVNTKIQEFLILMKRQLIVQWRNPGYSFMRITSSIVVSLYMGILFIGDKSTVNGAVLSVGAIFFLVFVLVIPMQAAVVPMVEDRAVLYRETVSGTYSRLSYGLGQLAADIPFHILNTLLMFVCFYFLVEFRTGADYMGYFLLMLFLANWVIQSLGQLFALATPNEESANGLAGLSIMLSVILMGFLITVSAMPDGWIWAYWVNLFHYILQGFVTNELAGQTYHLDLGISLPNITDVVPNATSLVAFGEGVDPMSSVAEQSANFLSLTSGIVGNGTGSIGDLSNLVKCLVENECLVDPVGSNFVSCAVFKLIGTPPCRDEFDAVSESIDLGEVAQCFLPSFGNGTDAALDDLSDLFAEEMDDESNLDLVKCLLGTILPENFGSRIVSILDGIFDIGMIVIDVVENGINLPGELILAFFGWADVNGNGEASAPYKWWYCMASVAIFLGAIELFKLIAVQKIVWTKR